MVAALILAAVLDQAGPLALILSAIGAVLTFAGLLVRQLTQQAGSWQHIVTAAEQRAEDCHTRNEALRTQIDELEAEVREERRLRMVAEQTTVAAQARNDTLELQLDEVRRQLDGYRRRTPAAQPAPKPPPKRGK